MSKIGVQQSTLFYNLNHYKNNRYVTKMHEIAYRPSALANIKNKNSHIYHSTITQ